MVREHTLCGLNSFKFIDPWFITLELVQWSVYRILQMHLRAYSLLLLGRIFYRCKFTPTGIQVVQIFCFFDDHLPSCLYITESVIWKSPVIIVECSIFSFPLQLYQFCFIYFEDLLLDTDMFIIVLCPGWIGSLVIISFFVSSDKFVLKIIFSEVGVAIPVLFKLLLLLA